MSVYCFTSFVAAYFQTRELLFNVQDNAKDQRCYLSNVCVASGARRQVRLCHVESCLQASRKLMPCNQFKPVSTATGDRKTACVSSRVDWEGARGEAHVCACGA